MWRVADRGGSTTPRSRAIVTPSFPPVRVEDAPHRSARGFGMPLTESAHQTSPTTMPTRRVAQSESRGKPGLSGDPSGLTGQPAISGTGTHADSPDPPRTQHPQCRSLGAIAPGTIARDEIVGCQNRRLNSSLQTAPAVCSKYSRRTSCRRPTRSMTFVCVVGACGCHSSTSRRPSRNNRTPSSAVRSNCQRPTGSSIGPVQRAENRSDPTRASRPELPQSKSMTGSNR